MFRCLMGGGDEGDLPSGDGQRTEGRGQGGDAGIEVCQAALGNDKDYELGGGELYNSGMGMFALLRFFWRFVLSGAMLGVLGVLVAPAFAQGTGGANTPPSAPVVNRAVAADWGAETFTLYWRPGGDAEREQVTGYKIFRSQNSDAGDNDRHPSDCDENAFGRSLEDDAVLVTIRSEWFEYTARPRGSGEAGVTHGNCYRWHIAAVNAAGVAAETSILDEEVVKDNPSLIAIATLLAGGADPNGVDGGLLLTAALLGRAEVVRALMEGGADGDARLPPDEMNVPMLMAHDGSSTLSLSQRLAVLRGFGEGERVQGGEGFDWNGRDGRGRHVAGLLMLGATGTDATKQEMADYMLTRGMNCGHETTLASRYHDYCTGTYGRALSELVNQKMSVTLVSEGDVRAAAQAMVDAGITLEAAGVPALGHLVAVAAFRGQHHALSVLLTFGMDPDGEEGGGNTALAFVAGGSDAVRGLALLRAFIGGLDGAGRLTGDDAYDGWNGSTPLGDKFLDDFHIVHASRADSEERDETHALFYEYGARCATPGTKKYCQIPTETITGTAREEGEVAVVSRAGLGFRALSGEVLATLTASGWGTALEAEAVPPRFVVSRSRVFQAGDESAVFTLTMTIAAGVDSRLVLASLAVVDDPAHVSMVASARASMIAAAEAGDAARVHELVTERSAKANGTGGVALVFEAAMRGHADVVSVLLTAGANADARAVIRDLSFNIPLYLSGWNSGHVYDEANVDWGQRQEVLRHFGDALEVRGTPYVGWNHTAGWHFARYLDYSELWWGQLGWRLYHAEWQAMADYALTRGMDCHHSPAWTVSPTSDRYSKYCVGTLGKRLADLVNQAAGSPPLTDEVREAAQAMVDAGISAELAGASRTPPAPLAALRGHAAALSVLLTFGVSPEARHGGRGALHYAARHANIPETGLEVLRHFMGGLSVAGKLEGFDGWNSDSGLDTGRDRPLDDFQSQATLAVAGTEGDLREMHSLLYERGARCESPGTLTYCGVPTSDAAATGTRWSGAVFTVTARAGLGFKALAGGASGRSLSAEGWAVLVERGRDPEELVVHRTRRPRGSPVVLDGAAIFTVTLTSSAGVDSHVVRISAGLAESEDVFLLVSAALEGDASETRRLLESTGAVDIDDGSGVPLLAEVARRGFGEIVSILVTFGYDPGARHTGLAGGSVPHIMARVDGSDLTREEKLGVLRHFGGAVAVRGTLHDWNSEDDNGERMLDLLLAAEQSGEDAGLIGETADYALARGGRCGDGATMAERARVACTGRTVAALLAAVADREATGEEVRAAAQGVVDEGFFAVSVVHAANGELVGLAALHGRAEAVSILITFGSDPKGRANERGALHHIGRGSDVNAAGMLEVLRHFIGGLAVAGKLDDFDGWNEVSNVGRPLLAVNNFAAVRRDEPGSAERRIHAILYERGARCDDGPVGERYYCGVPFDDIWAPLGVGAVLTVTAQGFAGERFPSPLFDAGKDATLVAAGWSATVNAVASPDEVVVSRRADGAEHPPVAFTVTLLSGAGAAAWEYRVSPRPLAEFATLPEDGSGGTLVANFESGTRVAPGFAATLSALPAEDFYFEEWQGANCEGRSLSCAATVSGDVLIVAAFRRDCAAAMRAEGTARDVCGECLDATLQDFEGACLVKPHAYYSAEPPIGGAGTLSADFESEGQVSVGVVLTFTATPGEGFYVAEWSSDGATCSGGDVSKTGAAGRVVCPITVTASETGTLNVVARFKSANPDCEGEKRQEIPGNRCGGCKEGYAELRGLCLPESGKYYENDEYSQREMCELLRGGFAENEAVCVNVDAAGTFCVLDSQEVFPCRGLFRRVLHCNLAYGRPGVNPFVCGGVCSGGRVAQGGECRGN